MSIENKSVNAIRFLGMDMINKANSGHPGIVLGAAPTIYTLFTRHLKANPKNSKWFNRDRFILSAGHGSAMLYSTLHLSGYNLEIEDLKGFRQWGSLTPGHPEYGHTDGVDATSGPLGQGIAMATGVAIGESFLAAKLNKENFNVIDHFTYVLCGDGDLQEGVSVEAMSLAGHLELDKLIVLYDSNDIQLDGSTSLCVTENVKDKYTAMGWNYLRVEDGSNIDEIDAAITVAKEHVGNPTIIEIKTVIGHGSPLAGDSGSHGAPLGVDKTKATKEALEYTEDEFCVADDVYKHFEVVTIERGRELNNAWDILYTSYASNYPEIAAEFKDLMAGELTIDLADIIPHFGTGIDEASRVTGGKILGMLSEAYPFIIGGSADLTKSTKAKGLDGDFTVENRTGRNINYGVREHAMGAIVNGLTLHGLKAFGGAFFVFSDYMKPAMRMAALMEIPSIYVFTHDSIAVGEDGPTHEPVEQLAGLRAMPNMEVIRPAEANETAAAWRLAMESTSRPTTIVLTRQNLTSIDSATYEGVKRGGYVISPEKERIDAILIATGSEVNLAINAQTELLNNGIDVRVVSIPSFIRFNQQTSEYIESVLPIACEKRLGIEMASSLGWGQYVGIKGKLLTIDRFGTSAPAKKAISSYGFTVENIVNIVKEF